MTKRTIAKFNFACLFVTGLSLIINTASTAYGQVIVPGADGSDGAFSPVADIQIDLSQAATAAWDGPNPNPGEGVYDPAKWAIVFRYSSVNIPAGVDVTFRNHPSNPPVVWLVSGTVTISGTVYVGGQPGGAAGPDGFLSAGPGGFRGAGSLSSTAGRGPGGGAVGANGDYSSGSGAYGNSRILPLIGGSGAGAPGGGGGGAILIAAPDTMTVNGSVDARGGYTGVGGQRQGAGGGVRVICQRLQGSGQLRATTDYGNNGRVRIEANEVAFGVSVPTPTYGLPGATATIWPESAAPTVRVVSLGAEGLPPEPVASFEFPYADVNMTTGTGQLLVIEAQNIPTGSDPPDAPAWNVRARIVPRGAAPFTVNATYVSGDYATSIWHATVNLPNGTSAIQVRASMP